MLGWINAWRQKCEDFATETRRGWDDDISWLARSMSQPPEVYQLWRNVVGADLGSNWEVVAHGPRAELFEMQRAMIGNRAAFGIDEGAPFFTRILPDGKEPAPRFCEPPTMPDAFEEHIEDEKLENWVKLQAAWVEAAAVLAASPKRSAGPKMDRCEFLLKEMRAYVKRYDPKAAPKIR